MPTKPSHKKHGKDYLDEAVAKSEYHRKPVSRNRAIVAGILALPMGCLGVHDFLLRNKKRGTIHMIISAIAFGMFFYPFFHGMSVVYQCTHGMECIDIHGYDDTLNTILVIGLIALAASIIWGVVEGIIILTHLNRFAEK